MYTRDCYACINGESQFVFKVPFKLSCKCFKVYAADSIANVFWILGICVCCVYSDQGGAMKLSCSPLVINLYISKMPITDLYVSIKFLNKLSLWVMLFVLIFFFSDQIMQPVEKTEIQLYCKYGKSYLTFHVTCYI